MPTLLLNSYPSIFQHKVVSLQPDKRSVTQETEEAEKQCIAFVSRILQKRLKGAVQLHR